MALLIQKINFLQFLVLWHINPCISFGTPFSYTTCSYNIMHISFVETCSCIFVILMFCIYVLNLFWRCPCGVMVKAMDCRIVVSEFEIQSCYYVHFQTNTLGKGMDPPYLPSYGLTSTTTVLSGEWLWH